MEKEKSQISNYAGLSENDKSLIADSIEHRADRQAKQITIIRAAKFAGNLLFIIFSTMMFILLIFMIMYLIKSALGIDIFPDRHLWDFFV